MSQNTKEEKILVLITPITTTTTTVTTTTATTTTKTLSTKQKEDNKGFNGSNASVLYFRQSPKNVDRKRKLKQKKIERFYFPSPHSPPSFIFLQKVIF